MTVFFCWIRPMVSLTFFINHIFGRGCFRCYIPVNLHDNGTNGPFELNMTILRMEQMDPEWRCIYIVPIENWWFSIAISSVPLESHNLRSTTTKKLPLNSENSSGWWNLIIWPDRLFHEHISHVSLPTTRGAASGIDLSHKAWVYPIIVAWTWGYGWLASMNSVGRF